MVIWVMGIVLAIGEVIFGLGNIVSSGLIFVFYEWRCKVELFVDRVVFLVMDDLNLVMEIMMKVVGVSSKYVNECSL